MISGIRNAIKQNRDKILIQKLLLRLYCLDERLWLSFSEDFNSWKFPMEFYDLIPKWWRYKMPIKRASDLINPVMMAIREKFGHKEELRFHNVDRGGMTNDEFEYWYSIHENGAKAEEYYNRRFEIESIKWWEDDVYEKLMKAKADTTKPKKN